MENQKRLAKLTIFLGHNRVGKTTTAVKMAENYRRLNPDNQIYRFDPQRKFEHISKTTKIVDNDWAFFLSKKDCLIVLDDYRFLLHTDSLDVNFLRLLSLRDEHGIDIMLITHHPNLIHERISYYTTELFLFYCNISDEIKTSGKLQNSEKVLFLMKKVNSYVNDFGKFGKQQNEFRYLIFDNVESRLKHCSFMPLTEFRQYEIKNWQLADEDFVGMKK